jgi:cytochrome P450
MAPSTVEFDPFSHDFFTFPYQTYRRLRDEAPVYYSSKYDFWALSRYEDVASAYRDHQTYSSAKGVTLDMIQISELMKDVPAQIIWMDPPEHDRMRKLVNKVFTPRAIIALETMVRDTIYDTLAGLAGSSFDVVTDFSALFPVEIITKMLGVPGECRQQIRHWIDAFLERRPGSIMPTQEGFEAAMAMGEFFTNLIAQRRDDPQDDMISRLIAVEITDDDGVVTRLSDGQIEGFARLLGGAGAETVTKLVANAIVVFADHPDQWGQLRHNPATIPAAIEELLRYDGPVQYNFRYSTRDITLHGSTIPANSAVMLITGSANRDERAFPGADSFDINRERKFGYNLGFGYGVHSCLGAALARMEARIALEALLELLPHYEIDRSGLQRVSMTNVCGWSNVPVRTTS